MNAIDVYTGHQPPAACGRLSRNGSRHVFSYRHDATEAVSLTMPVRHESYQHDELHPVFQMNLPEGALRQALERMTSKQFGSDDLTLLTILGRNQIGRIAYGAVDQAPPAHPEAPLDIELLLGQEKAGLFQALLQRYAPVSGVAGMQPKVLLDMHSRLTMTMAHYIVKSWGDDYPQLACNEFVCMSMARDAGLAVLEFHLSDNAELLVIKRFDMMADGRALGFEDFGVLQGKGTRQKYDSSLEACTNTIRQFVSPARVEQALYDFYKLTCLNVRVRNGDAHLKNIGVLYRDLQAHRSGKMPIFERQLAPVFDVVSTVPYLPGDTMALTLTGSKRWPKSRVLQAFGMNHCQLNRARIIQAEAEVEAGIQANQGLLETLATTHEGFAAIAAGMYRALQG